MQMPDESPFPWKFWLKWAAVWTVALIILHACTGCSTPGDAGFRILAKSNARERTTIKAVTVRSASIGRHTARAVDYADKLSRTGLTAGQQALLDGLRWELKQSEDERKRLDGLTKQLLADKTTDAATIASTRAEVHAALNVAWWEKYKFALWAFFIGLFGGGVVVWLLRATIHAGILAGSVYFPPLALLARKPTA